MSSPNSGSVDATALSPGASADGKLSNSGEFWASLSSLSYALTNVFSRVAVVGIDPIAAPAFRTLPTLVISWAQVLRRRGLFSTIRPSNADFIGYRPLFVLMAVGVGQIVIGTVGLFYAFQLGGVVLVVPVLATGMLWSALIAKVFLREPLNLRMMLGIVAAVLGIVVLAYGQWTGMTGDLGSLWAIPIALVPAVAWSFGANGTRYALRQGVQKYMALGIEGTWGVLCLLVILAVLGRLDILWTTSMTTIGFLMLAGILSAAAVVTGAYALSISTVASVQTINGLNPVIATIIAVIFLGEYFNVVMGIGTLLTVGAVIFVQVSMTRISTKKTDNWEAIV